MTAPESMAPCCELAAWLEDRLGDCCYPPESGAKLAPLAAARRWLACTARCATFTYSIAQHVEDVIGFIGQLDVGPVDLIGHWRGGHIAFRLAQRRPDLLRKIVLEYLATP